MSLRAGFLLLQELRELMDYYFTCWQKAFVLEGRARRSEYWFWNLGNFLLVFAFAFAGLPQLIVALQVLVIIPTICVSIRRLHDIGKSGWWFLLAPIPIINLIFLYFFCCDSTPGANKYGPSPKSDSLAIPAST